MIKVGDKFNLNNENWEVIFIDSDAVVVARSENGEEGIVSQRTIYKNWCEQQKQRADELAELYVQSEKESESLSISLCERIERYHERTTKLIQEKSKAVERADELEKRWSELREWLDEQSSEYMTKYRKTYNERDDEKSETYNEIFNKMMTIEKEDNNA